MKNSLNDTIDSIKDDGTILSLDEAKIINSVVLKILSNLGWDIFNVQEVVPEHNIGGRRVDLALILSDKSQVFIEVKRPNENLEPHQQQLLEYSFKEGVKLAVLTNGLRWWFYLPLQEGSWEQRRFYVIDVLEQATSDATERLIEFLEKDGISTGQAFKRAEEVYRGTQKKEILRKALPKAWEKLIGEPDDLLVDLIIESTESHCGFRPDVEDVEEFLQSEVIPSPQACKNLEKTTVPSRSQKYSTKFTASSIDYMHTKCEHFQFLGKEYRPKTWRELLSRVAEEMYRTHRADFERCLSLRGTRRLYFSKNQNDLKYPKNIAGSKFYFEANSSANSIVKIAKALIGLFGYKGGDLRIKARRAK